MGHMLIAFTSALWLGILTSISPCPLATNVAAVSFLSKRIEHTKAVLWSGMAYIFGRMVSYAVLGFIIIYSLSSVPVVANFLQKYMNKALGPILVVVGLFLLNLFKFNTPGFSLSREKQNSLVGLGIKGSFTLGAIFALAFCPLSAALFFGALIPLSLQSRCGTILPFFYGLGTGLPVLFFAVCIAVGMQSFARWFHKFTRLEYYARKVTGMIFILVGLYYIGTHLLAVIW